MLGGVGQTSLPKSDNNMKPNTLDLIIQKAEASKGITGATIEYNVELPKHPYIKKDNFFGVEAKFNPLMKKGTVNSIYKM